MTVTVSTSAPATAPARLAATVRAYAAWSELWRPLVRFTSPDRWYQRLARNDTFEVWLLTWLPGQGTEIHDHGGSAGAFGVVQGSLTEHGFSLAGTAPRSRTLHDGAVRSFGPRHIHQVVNEHDTPAVSVHAYAPALARQTYYQLGDDGRTLRQLRTEEVTE